VKRLLLFSWLLIALSACGMVDALLTTPAADDQTPTSAIDVPEGLIGEFYCSGHEFGLLAFAGRLVLSEGGGVALYWMDTGPAMEGIWRYDPGVDLVTFSDEMEISHAEFNPETEVLQVYLREGVERAHVELGVMTCLPQE
jgi:hypothetical protein